MKFSVSGWLNQIVIEGIKYILIAHYFLGFEFRKGKMRYLLFFYPLFIPIVESWNNLYLVYLYYYAWGAIMLLGLFKEKMAEKIRAFFTIWFLIALADTLLMMFYIAFSSLLIRNGSIEISMIIDSIGAMLWGIMARKGKRIQLYTKNFWGKLSNREYILVLVILIPISVMVGVIQSSLDNTTSVSMEEATFILVMFAVCTFMIVLIWFLYTKQSKERLEEVNRLSKQYLELQKRYYEDSLRQYEDMRSFRHDINYHIHILLELCKKDKITQLKEYLGTMAESYEKMKGVHTGNFIADCIIGHTLYKLQEKEMFCFDIEGHFPKDFFLEDIDFCILLSNLLENAKEALEKISGKCFLQIEIKRFQQWFYLIIRNSSILDEIDFQTTSKLDKRNHGFGMQNIRRIVEKYYGNITWNYENGVVEVKIKFDQGKLK